MKEQSLGLAAYLLGYPIALAIMAAFYFSELLEAGLAAARQLLAIPPAGNRR